jgi:hypothetical protein
MFEALLRHGRDGAISGSSSAHQHQGRCRSVAGEFRPIREINNEIRRLNLGSYAPLRYVLPHKQAAYDEKYSTKIRGGESFFRQSIARKA